MGNLLLHIWVLLSLFGLILGSCCAVEVTFYIWGGRKGKVDRSTGRGDAESRKTYVVLTSPTMTEYCVGTGFNRRAIDVEDEKKLLTRHVFLKKKKATFERSTWSVNFTRVIKENA